MLSSEDIADLVDYLHRRGLPASPAHAIAATSIVSALADVPQGEVFIALRRYLRPVVAASPEHLGLFDEAYLDWLRLHCSVDFEGGDIPRTPPRWLVPVSLATVCIAVSVLLGIVLPGPVELTGRVVDADGAPVEDAVVSATVHSDTYHCKSDTDGAFLLQLPKGTGGLDLAIEKEKYKSIAISKAEIGDFGAPESDTAGGGSDLRDYVLIRLREPLTFRGTVVDDTGTPLPDVAVVIRPFQAATGSRADSSEKSVANSASEHVIQRTGRTDETGSFEIVVPPGSGSTTVDFEGRLTASKTDYRGVTIEVSSTGETTDLEPIRLVPTQNYMEFTGRVVDMENQGVIGAEVKIREESGGLSSPTPPTRLEFPATKTDETGSFRLAVLRADLQKVVASSSKVVAITVNKSGFETLRQRLSITIDQLSEDVEMDLGDLKFVAPSPDRPLLPATTGIQFPELHVSPGAPYSIDNPDAWLYDRFWKRLLLHGKALWALLPLAVGILIVVFLDRLHTRPFFSRLSSILPRSVDSLTISQSNDLFDSKILKVLARNLRLRIAVASRRLATRETVAATIKRSGLFTPVYFSLNEPRHLFLVGSKARNDHAVSLVSGFVGQLARFGVDLELWLHHGEPRLLTNITPAPSRNSRIRAAAEPSAGTRRSLENLLKKNPGSRVILFGYPEEFIEPLTGKLASWVSHILSRNRCLLLVPDGPTAGQIGSPALRHLKNHGILVVPFTSAGFVALANLLSGAQREAPTPKGTRRNRSNLLRPELCLTRFPPGGSLPERLLGEIRATLSPDARLWLAACCVYPEIHWPLTLKIGASLFGEGDRLFTAVPQISHLPWMREGFAPEWFRAAMLTELSDEQRKRLRREVSQVLVGASLNKRGFLHVVADDKRNPPPADTLAETSRNAAEGSPLRDYVFLRFISGKKVDQTALRVPRRFLETLRRKPHRRWPARAAIATATVLASMACLIIFKRPPLSATFPIETIIMSPAGGAVLFLGGPETATPDGGRHATIMTERAGSPVPVGAMPVAPEEVAFVPDDTVALAFDGFRSWIGLQQTVNFRPLNADGRRTSFEFESPPVGGISTIQFSDSAELGVAVVEIPEKDSSIVPGAIVAGQTVVHLQFYRWQSSGSSGAGKTTMLALDQRPVAIPGLGDEYPNPRFTADGSKVIVEIYSEDSLVYQIFNVATREWIEDGARREVDGDWIRVSHDGSKVASVMLQSEGEEEIWSLNVAYPGSTRDPFSIGSFSTPIRWAAFDPLEPRIAIVTGNDECRIHSLEDGSLLKSLPRTHDAEFQPDGNALFTVETDGTVVRRSTAGQQFSPLGSVRLPEALRPTIQFSPDGQTVECLGFDAWNNGVARSLEADSLSPRGPAIFVPFQNDPSRWKTSRTGSFYSVALPHLGGFSDELFVNPSQILRSGARQKSRSILIAPSIGSDGLLTEDGLHTIVQYPDGIVAARPIEQSSPTLEAMSGASSSEIVQTTLRGEVGQLIALPGSHYLVAFSESTLQVFDPLAPAAAFPEVGLSDSIRGIAAVPFTESLYFLTWQSNGKINGHGPIFPGELLEPEGEISLDGDEIEGLQVVAQRADVFSILVKGREGWSYYDDDVSEFFNVTNPGNTEDAVLMPKSTVAAVGSNRRITFLTLDRTLPEPGFVPLASPISDLENIAGYHFLHTPNLFVTWQAPEAGGKMQFWDPSSGREVAPILPEGTDIELRVRRGPPPAFTPRGEQVFLAHEDGSVVAWQIRNPVPAETVYSSMFEQLEFASDLPDGTTGGHEEGYWARINESRSIYEQVEARSQVPWYAVAVIHTLLNDREFDVPLGSSPEAEGATALKFEEWIDSAVNLLPDIGFLADQEWSIASLLRSFDRMATLYPRIPNTWAGTNVNLRPEQDRSRGAAAYLKFDIGLEVLEVDTFVGPDALIPVPDAPPRIPEPDNSATDPATAPPPDRDSWPYALLVPGKDGLVTLPGEDASVGEIDVTGIPPGTPVYINDPRTPGRKIYFRVP